MMTKDRSNSGPTRRDFLKHTVSLGALSILPAGPSPVRPEYPEPADWTAPDDIPDFYQSLDLSPAKWIWYPSGRTLANTFFLFRRTLELNAEIRSAKGWILADSRYKLYVNGRRVQFGPSPADPRWPEADPLDLADYLQAGSNTIGAEVLYYGYGDGTWPMGKPGFIFLLQIETESGATQTITSDAAWQVHLARSWRPGQYKRWYLRALQEEFDARKYPYGWTENAFRPDEHWLPAMEITGSAAKPALCHRYGDYMGDSQGASEQCAIRNRSVGMLKEFKVAVKKLSESHYLEWQRPPEEYFEFVTPNAFTVTRTASARPAGPDRWEVDLRGRASAVLTFELEEQIVGFPYFSIEAPAGTIVELLVQEGHEVGGPPLMNDHFHAWTRFVCREGINHFETFDYESLRWIQLLIRNSEENVVVENIGVRRRIQDWARLPEIECSDPDIQKVLNASVNTLHNAAQETLVDGMGRERQQYSGDIGHALHVLFLAFGDRHIPARFVVTYSQGITKDGFFLDCWPAYDRLHRLAQRQLDLTPWGPLLDHGVGFNFDCYHYYLYSGDLSALKEVYPRLLTFLAYLQRIRLPGGLLPVEDIGVPTVWIDHEAYRQQRHKQCAFNLYAAAMLRHALAPLCRAFKDPDAAKKAERFSKELLRAATRSFWSSQRGLFVDNLPWLQEEKTPRYSDRTLATALLFDQFPNQNAAPAARMLAECPPEMGFSYPANANWRLWALAKSGNVASILQDLRTRWAGMDSVQMNNTLQENWVVRPNTTGQWSHCPVAPLFVMYMNIAGIQVLEPGFRKIRIRPQLGDLESLQLRIPSPLGDIHFVAQGQKGSREITIRMPSGMRGELVLDKRERVELPLSGTSKEERLKKYIVHGEQELRISLRHT